MFRKLLTTSDVDTNLLRPGPRCSLLCPRAQKMLGWFGGYGFSGTMGYFTMAEFPRRSISGSFARRSSSAQSAWWWVPSAALAPSASS